LSPVTRAACLALRKSVGGSIKPVESTLSILFGHRCDHNYKCGAWRPLGWPRFDVGGGGPRLPGGALQVPSGRRDLPCLGEAVGASTAADTAVAHQSV